MRKKFLVFAGLFFVLVFSVSVSAQWTSDLNTDLVAYWSLDGTSGTVTDELGINNGTNFGATRGVAGIIASAFDYDPLPADFTTLMIIDDLTDGHINSTWNLWVNPDTYSGGDDVVLSVGLDGSNDEHFVIAIQNGVIDFDYFIKPNLFLRHVGAGNILVNTWNMITVTRAGNNLSVYLNGAIVDSQNMVAGGVVTDGGATQLVYVGKREDNIEGKFDGTIDEIGLWNRVLNDSEITQLYNNGNGTPTNSPPAIEPVANISIIEGGFVSVTVNATDPNGDDLTYLIQPEGFFTQQTNLFTWQTDYDDIGHQNFTIEVNDGLESVFEDFSVTVLANTDLVIDQSGIFFSNNAPNEGEIVYITAIFSNTLDINPPSIGVAFWDGDPSNGGILIGMDTITTGGRTDSYFAQAQWTSEPGVHDIFVVLDPQDNIAEPDETNNIAFKPLSVTALPDFMIRTQDIGFTNPSPQSGEQINILAMIHNLGSASANNVNVLFYLDDLSNIISQEVLNIDDYSTQFLMVQWIAIGGEHTIGVFVDLNNSIMEINESNNQASRTISVQGQNLPPELYPVGDRTVTVDRNLLINLEATDPNNDTLLFSTNAVSVLPSEFNFNPITGVFNWRPSRHDYGVYDVTFSVTDGTFVDEKTSRITVRGRRPRIGNFSFAVMPVN